MLHAIIEKLSDYPAFFLFCRGILEANFRVIRDTIRTHLEPSPKRTVLDVACGPGAFSDLFPSESYSGIDLNPKYIDYAKSRYRGHFQVQDATKIDYPADSFDDVLVYGLLHHLSDEDVRAVGAILNVNDVVAFVVVNGSAGKGERAGKSTDLNGVVACRRDVRGVEEVGGSHAFPMGGQKRAPGRPVTSLRHGLDAVLS